MALKATFADIVAIARQQGADALSQALTRPPPLMLTSAAPRKSFANAPAPSASAFGGASWRPPLYYCQRAGISTRAPIVRSGH